MNRLAIQLQLTALALAELQIAIHFVCLWRQVDGPGSYPTISTYTIVICTSPPYQSNAHRLLQEILSLLDEQSKFPTGYLFQCTMILSDQSYAQKIQEQNEFQANEEVASAHHWSPSPQTFETLGGALLSFPEPSPGSQ